MKTNTIVAALRFTRNSVLISLLGLLIGIMVVIMPPMAAIGVVGMVAAVLIWVTPEINQVSPRALRKVFLAFLVIQVCVPNYYAVQVAGLPWISPRRIIGMLLIVSFVLIVGTSRDASRAIIHALRGSRLLAFCVIGFLVMAFLSIFTSVSPGESLSHFSDAVLNWYIPMFACLLVVDSEDDIVHMFKLIGIMSLFVASVGIVEFVEHHRIALDLIPKSLLSSMMANNPSLAEVVNSNPIRNGFWRASSIYNEPLSFGEFAVMVAPVGAYFIMHGAKWTDRLLGMVVLIIMMAALFVSGSRGGTVGFVIAMPIFAALWVVRHARSRPFSLVGPISAAVALIGTGSMIAAIFLVGRLNRIVFGGGEAVASDDGRFQQWSLGIPHILANPVTGHGLGMGAEVVGWVSAGGTPSIDSYVLTVLVETGVPGLVFFFGGLGLAVVYCAKLYLEDYRDERTAIAAPLACIMIAFGFYRIALSQRENHTLFFILLGLVFKLLELHSKRRGVRISESPSVAA